MMRQRLSSAVSLPALCSVFVDTKSALVCAFFSLSFPYISFLPVFSSPSRKKKKKEEDDFMFLLKEEIRGRSLPKQRTWL